MTRQDDEFGEGFTWGKDHPEPEEWQIDPNGVDPDQRAPADAPPEGEDGDATRAKVRADELRGRLLDAEGLFRIPTPVPLVEGFLYTNSLAWLGGKPGHGKTFVAVDLGFSVATGRPWHGHATTQGPVLYIIAEGAAGLGQRVRAWMLESGTPQADGLWFLPVPVNLADPLDVSALSALLADLRPVLVIIDTQARVTLGLDENSSRDMGRFVEMLERLRRESRACLLLAHHEPRGGDNLRGSTALEGAATTIMRVVKDGQVITVSNTKQKDAEQAAALRLALVDLAGSCILSNEGVGMGSLLTGSQLALLGQLGTAFGKNGATRTELKEAAEMPSSTFYWAINALVSTGKVVEQVEGRTRRYLPAALDGQLQIPMSPTESR